MYRLLFLISDEHLRNVIHLALIFLLTGAGFYLHGHFQRRSQSGPAAAESISRLDAVRFFLPAALLIGLALRFYGLDWGLPQPFHPDEFEEADFLVRMIKNHTIDPNYFQQPPLILYLSWPFVTALKIFGLYADSTLVRSVLAGRIVNALAGTISIYLVYAIGRRVSGVFTGSAAALFFAFFPLAVTNSRYMKQDSLLLMFVLMCALSVLQSSGICNDNQFEPAEKAALPVRKKVLIWLAAAGLFAGMAMASKYSGAACIGIIMSRLWLRPGRFSYKPDLRAAIPVAASLAAMFLAFMLCNPAVLLYPGNLQHLIDGIRFELQHARYGHHGLAIDAWSQLWMYHFSRSLIPGAELVPVMAALIGAGLVIARFEACELWVLGLLLMFYLPAEMAHSKPPPQPDRYVLPCTAFVALLAAECLNRFRRGGGGIRATRTAFVVAACPLLMSLLLAAELTNDTRSQMRDWLGQNLPPGTTIVRTGAASYLPQFPSKLTIIPGKRVIPREKTSIIEALKASPYEYLIATSFTKGRLSIQHVADENRKASDTREAFRKIEEAFPIAKKISSRCGSYGFHNPEITLYALHPERLNNVGQPSP